MKLISSKGCVNAGLDTDKLDYLLRDQQNVFAGAVSCTCTPAFRIGAVLESSYAVAVA